MLTAIAAPRKRKAVDNRVYLVHADELKFDMYGPNPDAQIVKGHVHFLHRGATLTCDSAYFYQITLTCQRAWYDGEEQLMEARNNVVLHHARQTLYTDSLNYDRLYNNAYFFRGGRLIDGTSKLSSDWGEYNTETKQAVFYYDVQLHTPKTRAPHVSSMGRTSSPPPTLTSIPRPTRLTSMGARRSSTRRRRSQPTPYSIIAKPGATMDRAM